MNRLKQKYQQEIQKKLVTELKLANQMAAPKIKKIVVNMGISDPVDTRERMKAIDNISQQLAIITGQKPVITRARKAISEFSLQKGDPLGLKVTLRGERMWEFLDKLISIVLPRVKDFRGVSRIAFDGRGNYSLGLEEQIVFPEINYDEIEGIRSLQVTFITSTENNEHAFKLLELLGIPFAKEE
jgi:large subunit ribosomal protein L5